MKKSIKKIIAACLSLSVITSLAATTVSANTADTTPSAYAEPNYINYNKTATSKEVMSVSLNPGAKGTSNVITFTFSGIPEDAEVFKIKISGKASTDGAFLGGIGLVESVTLIAPDGTKYSYPWGIGNVIEINKIEHMGSNGVWKMYFTAQNTSKTKPAYTAFSNNSVTISYRK